jgi:D-inositol-3-phosphate glycosyltransferase
VATDARQIDRLRVLYSFPYPLGAPGVGTTALNQVRGLALRGVDVTVYCTSLHRRVPDLPATIVETMSLAGRRVPHRAIGVSRALRYHDWRVARVLAPRSDDFDVIHGWPLSSRQTFRIARSAGITAVRESPNCYTAVAYERAERAAVGLGLVLPRGASHRFDAGRLAREEEEYDLATAVLVPSEFAKRSYEKRPGSPVRTIQHSYGFDPDDFPTPQANRPHDGGLVVAFVGRCDPRKGVHYAIEAWEKSGLGGVGGRFIICGDWDFDYSGALSDKLNDPSIELRPFTKDVGSLLRGSDVLVLPSVEEGSALVTFEAQASGCALLVSDAAGARITDGVHGFVHAAGDVEALAAALKRLGDDPVLLSTMRHAVIERRNELTWMAAARRLEDAYRLAMAGTPAR